MGNHSRPSTNLIIVSLSSYKNQTQSQMKWGSEDKETGGWTSTRARMQVAMAKLDLNKTRVFSTAAKGI